MEVLGLTSFSRGILPLITFYPSKRHLECFVKVIKKEVNGALSGKTVKGIEDLGDEWFEELI